MGKRLVTQENPTVACHYLLSLLLEQLFASILQFLFQTTWFKEQEKLEMLLME